MEEFEFVTSARDHLEPLGIKVICYEKNGVYWVEVDGTSVYPNPEDWERNWGKDFAGFTKWFLTKHITTKPKLLTKTHVKYKIGTLLDILKHQ
jgi:hypothetical protein